MLTIGQSPAGGMAVLSLAVATGLALGAVRVRGVRLGISGVLFSSLLLGQVGLSVSPAALEFLRDFALILFVYAIGLQVGPGFLGSLKADGLRLNLLSVLVLALGALLAAGVGRARGMGPGDVPGLYTGAFTTTPGLAAAQEALRRGGSGAPGSPAVEHAARASPLDRAGLAYSITYPLGVIGPVFVIAALRWAFKVRLEDERRGLAAREESRRPPIEVVDFEVTEPAYAGRPLRGHPLFQGSGVVLSRMMRGATVAVPTADTELRVGDVYRAVGPRSQVSSLVARLGRASAVDLSGAAGDLRRAELVVTRTDVLRRSLRELDLVRRTGVTIARVNRAGVDLLPHASLRLAFADRVTVVGPAAGIDAVERELGNCPETLNRPQLIPIFLGIVLGVLAGSIPLKLPGLHVTVRIGLAGGPMLVAIALSQLGNVGSVVWYMPTAANQLFRDFGLAVFLACVGFQSGDHFLQRVLSGGGIALVGWGILITMVPVFLVGCFARVAFRMNFVTLSGWVAGAMTSSPALLFADELAASDAPAVAYAAVAPLATLVPILCAQILAIGPA